MSASCVLHVGSFQIHEPHGRLTVTQASPGEVEIHLQVIIAILVSATVHLKL